MGAVSYIHWVLINVEMIITGSRKISMKIMQNSKVRRYGLLSFTDLLWELFSSKYFSSALSLAPVSNKISNLMSAALHLWLQGILFFHRERCHWEPVQLTLSWCAETEVKRSFETSFPACKVLPFVFLLCSGKLDPICILHKEAKLNFWCSLKEANLNAWFLANILMAAITLL